MQLIIFEGSLASRINEFAMIRWLGSYLEECSFDLPALLLEVRCLVGVLATRHLVKSLALSRRLLLGLRKLSWLRGADGVSGAMPEVVH